MDSDLSDWESDDDELTNVRATGITSRSASAKTPRAKNVRSLHQTFMSTEMYSAVARGTWDILTWSLILLIRVSTVPYASYHPCVAQWLERGIVVSEQHNDWDDQLPALLSAY